ncbi:MULTISPECIES: pentapeptide repeat-containing protein [Halobacterium]|uniref:pentapeptide repeat-containing protein n=1 Tax=Halobacterium TaxID=2239 RepID=UPI001963B131|nr:MULTISPECIES: pentapeptide repeat-containing protein [Halobacterium]MCF2168566.1 pentapeptide repeat-containing protein [Halobacterium salinarum]MCF2239255.1 pentapeptide repeat-containing protein [Halobacterium salinarum]QRY22024.1 pentapeptide repeat-containing protein [Halobacterium sp. GSL-19]WJK63411.1 pentapeptide repeat-containing protein [Halobacterium salinarum]
MKEASWCSYTLNPKTWESEYNAECQVDPEDDAEILEEIDGQTVWRCPHEAVEEHDGEDRCIFHLPKEKRPNGINPVEEFIAIVQGEREVVESKGRRPARFIDATFENLNLDREQIGDGAAIDLRHARIGEMKWDIREVDAQLDAAGAVVEGDCDVAAVSFRDRVRFREMRFRSEVNFSDVTFEDFADFPDVTFEDFVNFPDATFEDFAGFLDATFEDFAGFPGATFEDFADFLDATFEDSAGFSDATFEDFASFSDATFEDFANFSDATFEDFAGFPGATFEDSTNFPDATFEDSANFEGIELNGAIFRDAVFSNGNLKNAELEGADLRDADLTGADLRDADLSGADLENAVLTRTQLYGADFRDARLHGTLFGDAHISHATTFVERGNRWAPHRQVVGYLNRLPKVDFAEPQTVIYDPRTDPVCETDEDEISNVTRAATVYQKLESLAEDNAASSLASTCFTWRKDMERKRLSSGEGEGNSRQPVSWALSWLSNLVTRYGESPYRVLATVALIVLSCGGLYYWFDLIQPDLPAQAPIESLPPVSLFDAMYFSTMTFTTLGYGDFRPASQVGQILAISETSAGVVLLALLVFVFGRRATR